MMTDLISSEEIRRLQEQKQNLHFVDFDLQLKNIHMIKWTALGFHSIKCDLSYQFFF